MKHLWISVFALGGILCAPVVAAAQAGSGENCTECESFISAFCDGSICHNHNDGTHHENAQNHSSGTDYPLSCNGAHGDAKLCLAMIDLQELGEAIDGLMFSGDFRAAQEVLASADGIAARLVQEDRYGVELAAQCESGSLVQVFVPLPTGGVEYLGTELSLDY